MLTRTDIDRLVVGQTLHHTEFKNRDGTPLRVRVNGKPQTWKTRPQDFRIPYSYGLYNHGYITQLDADYWEIA